MQESAQLSTNGLQPLVLAVLRKRLVFTLGKEDQNKSGTGDLARCET